MISIASFIRGLRGRIPMFVGTNSIPKLADFLRGYQHALDQTGVLADPSFLKEFQRFVEQKYKVPVSRSWDQIISFVAADEGEAVELFWELIDEHFASVV
jgi:hypothetical protein